jgi:amidase
MSTLTRASRALAVSSSRRDFLRAAGLFTASASTPALLSSRASAAPAHATSTDPTEDLIYVSATKLAQLIREKKVSAVEAVEAFITRQIAVNDRLNAVVMNCYERARAEARAADAALARGELKGPLHGVPMIIKDSLDTEGVISTGATYGRQQFVPAKDATCVARVRAAGAILLGKTNTPEFTLGGLGGISAASNLLYGSSHNPYDLTRTTSGSSGGAGAGVAAGLASFDIGSDWGGSIRGPAHSNGIVGIKPTSVRVPRTGHIVDYGGVFDLWQQLGPMTRRVEDIALITPLISGPDYRDASCAPVPWADPSAVELKKLRAAFFPTNPVTKADADTQAAIKQCAAWLEGVVASLTEDFPESILRDLYESRRTLTNGDAWAFYQRLADKWGTKNFSPSVKERMKTMQPISTAAYVEAWERADLSKSRMLEWFKKYDVLLCPVAATPAGEIDTANPSGGGGAGWSYTNPFNTTGWPVTVVRVGTSSDGRKLPIGVQVVAAPWREDITIAVASYLESKGGGWQRPPI